jgi:23S rRNA (uracil1939-C5)-methyltransferase
MKSGRRETERLDLTIERPVVGGAMLARHQGRVVLVGGAIPGERVRARVDRERRDVVYATTEEIVEPHPARRAVEGDSACGGQVYRHIEYSHQLGLKADVVRDGLRRIARLDLPSSVPVAASKEAGYRMRARLRVGPAGLGFLRQGSHTVCDATETGQLLPTSGEVVAELGRRVCHERHRVAYVDLAENVASDQRVIHLRLRRRVPAKTLSEWTSGLSVTGVSATHADNREVDIVSGIPTVADPVSTLLEDSSVPGRLIRHAPSFYQSNRYLLPALVSAVHRRVRGSVLDLYAGVGAFSVTLAARGVERVTAVERDTSAVADLQSNATAVSECLTVVPVAVEDYLARQSGLDAETVIVDPPRLGLGRAVIDRLVALGARRLVYVSCDVATFARDLRRFIDQGYALGNGDGNDDGDIEAFDMFPNTAHIELVATLTR